MGIGLTILNPNPDPIYISLPRSDPSPMNRYHTLARAWLQEVTEEDLIAYEGLPGLSCALPAHGEDPITDLAVAYQHLFGFNAPPYESVYLDPSAMILAPATERVEAFYARRRWTPPAGARVAAADHIGLELWLLGDLMQAGRVHDARALVQNHLAFWLPLLAHALTRVDAHPFYTALADESVDAVLPLLDQAPSPLALPELPPRPRYLAAGMAEPMPQQAAGPELDELVRKLLTPRDAGLYLTRDELGRMSRRLQLPPVMSDRRAMLIRLFRLAGEYDEVGGLLDVLNQVLDDAMGYYQGLAGRFPPWEPYARLWQGQVARTRAALKLFPKQGPRATARRYRGKWERRLRRCDTD